MDFKFKVGDELVFVNSNGVCWGKVTIVKLYDEWKKPAYFIEPTDCPWCPVSEDELKDIQDIKANRCPTCQCRLCERKECRTLDYNSKTNIELIKAMEVGKAIEIQFAFYKSDGDMTWDREYWTRIDDNNWSCTYGGTEVTTYHTSKDLEYMHEDKCEIV